MTVARGFLLRDLRAAWSYRFNFVVQCVSLIASVVSLKFVAELFATSAPPALAAYGGDYFSFVLVGTTIGVLSYPMVKSFGDAVRSAQVTGTFEAMLTTRASAVGIVLSAGLYPIALACFEAILVVAVGALLLGAELRAADLLLVALVLTMTAACLAGVGLISAAFTVAFKQGEPFSGAMLAASFLLSGILYPTSVLPAWLAPLAQLLPLTHAIALGRALLLDGAQMGQIAGHALALAAFCLLFPLGMVALSQALNYARRAGTLSHY